VGLNKKPWTGRLEFLVKPVVVNPDDTLTEKFGYAITSADDLVFVPGLPIPGGEIAAWDIARERAVLVPRDAVAGGT